jgi:uncharacterized protein (TIGR01244 family)
MRFVELDDKTLVSGQLQAADMADAAANGVTMIVNNRPDGEEPDQPKAAEIEAAAIAAGLDYTHIPIVDIFSDEKVEAMAAALADAEGRVLAFCRSGTRSTYVWALARARSGAEAGDLIRRATNAGYNIRPLMQWLNPAD